MTSTLQSRSIIDNNTRSRASTEHSRRPQSAEIRRRPAPGSSPIHNPLGPSNDPYSESVANSDLDNSGNLSGVPLTSAKSIPGVASQGIRRSVDAHTRQYIDGEASPRRSLTHKRSADDLRTLARNSPPPTPEKSAKSSGEPMGFLRRALSRGRKGHSRKSTAEDKDLPEVPRRSEDPAPTYPEKLPPPPPPPVETNGLPTRGRASDRPDSPTMNTSPTIARKPILSQAVYDPSAASPAVPAAPPNSAVPTAAVPVSAPRDTTVLDPKEFAHLADPNFSTKINTLARLPSEIDISNTVDTMTHTVYAPAVTHEVVEEKVHEIITEEITREIHHHDIYHRVLPVLEFEVLPARHWVKLSDGSGLREMLPTEIPGGLEVAAGLNRCIAEAVRNFDPRAVVTTPTAPVVSNKPSAPIIPAVFTARSFPGTEGDTKSWTDEMGVKRSEQWWVHPPRMENDQDWIVDGTAGERGVEMHFWHGEGNPDEAAVVNGTDVDATELGGVALQGLGKTQGGVLREDGRVEKKKLLSKEGDVVAHALPTAGGIPLGAKARGEVPVGVAM